MLLLCSVVIIFYLTVNGRIWIGIDSRQVSRRIHCRYQGV